MATRKKKHQAGRLNNTVQGISTSPTLSANATSPKIKRHKKYMAALLAFCSAAVAIKEFAYPIVIDYIDGKFGSSLELTINNAPLNQNIPTYVFFPAGDAQRSDRFLIPVGLALRNDAQVKVSEVTLSARFEKAAHRAEMDEFIVHAGTRPSSDVKNETNGNSHYDYAVHRVNFLAPHESFNFTEGGASHTVQVGLVPFEPILFSAFHGMDLQVTAFSDRDEEQI